MASLEAMMIQHRSQPMIENQALLRDHPRRPRRRSAAAGLRGLAGGTRPARQSPVDPRADRTGTRGRTTRTTPRALQVEEEQLEAACEKALPQLDGITWGGFERGLVRSVYRRYPGRLPSPCRQSLATWARCIACRLTIPMASPFSPRCPPSPGSRNSTSAMTPHLCLRRR